MCFGLYIVKGSLRSIKFLTIFGFCAGSIGISAGVIRYISKGSTVAAIISGFLLSVSSGLFMTAVVHFTLIQNEVFTGIPGNTITMISGVGEKDSLEISDNLIVIPVSVNEVSNMAGTVTSASGTISAFIRSETQIYWGEVITLHGDMMVGNKGEWIFRGEMKESNENVFRHPVFRFRALGLSGIIRRIRGYGAQSSGLFEALFLGVKDDLSMREADLFKKAGCTHILALSGMHLGIISGLLFFLFRPVIGKNGSFLFVTIIIIFYIILTGMRPALLRASIMFFLYGFGALLNKKGDIKSIFLLTFLFLVIVTPKAVFTLSFQLSFIALGGILFLGTAIFSWLKTYLPSPVSLPISAAIGAQTATSPIIVSVFGTLYPVGILASIIVTPLISIFMIGGIVTMFLPFHRIGALVFRGLDILYGIIIQILKSAAFIPGVRIESSVAEYVFWIGPAVILILPALTAFYYRNKYRLMSTK